MTKMLKIIMANLFIPISLMLIRSFSRPSSSTSFLCNIPSGSYNHLGYIIIKESLTKDCLGSLLLRRPATAERNGVGS